MPSPMQIGCHVAMPCAARQSAAGADRRLLDLGCAARRRLAASTSAARVPCTIAWIFHCDMPGRRCSFAACFVWLHVHDIVSRLASLLGRTRLVWALSCWDRALVCCGLAGDACCDESGLVCARNACSTSSHDDGRMACDGYVAPMHRGVHARWLLRDCSAFEIHSIVDAAPAAPAVGAVVAGERATGEADVAIRAGVHVHDAARESRCGGWCDRCHAVAAGDSWLCLPRRQIADVSDKVVRVCMAQVRAQYQPKNE
mmetsp:Transcript_14054/g.38611  ORF Transcript_14054/g.38611 Transcript_14054/m.38611 type:complete len:257 (+) Transcript_14054:381-1151(+)